ncbi:hypothetical protein [Natrarchaeobius oligotrophus]|nr:hypothetical protein [Natrarchaeobius chitinivorans]
MSSDRWKVIKSILYASMATGFLVFTVLWDVHPHHALAMGVLLFLFYHAAEVKEVEITRYISVTFKNGHSKNTSDDSDRED